MDKEIADKIKQIKLLDMYRNNPYAGDTSSLWDAIKLYGIMFGLPIALIVALLLFLKIIS